MDVVLVPGGMRFSAQIDAGVERALKATGHQVRTLCRPCLTTLGDNALAGMKADLLLSIHGRRFPHAALAHAPSIRVKAVWLVDEPQEVDLSEGYGKHFDIVLTNERNTCGVHGPHKTWYLPLAADPSIHAPATELQRRDTSATGASLLPADGERMTRANAETQRRREQQLLLGLKDVAFAGGILRERARLLDEAYRLTPDLAWRIVGPDRHGKEVNFASVWDRRPISHEEYVGAVRSARIVLDIPRDEALSFAGRTNRRGIPATGVGCRPFEVTACGRFLLTDDSRADIFTFFPHGSVGIYRAGDAADLAAQLRYYLDHEEEREEAAAEAHAWTLGHHTYAHRVRELTEIVDAWNRTRTAAQPAGPAKRAARPGPPAPTASGARAQLARYRQRVIRPARK
jgi:hypothetical protein